MLILNNAALAAKRRQLGVVVRAQHTILVLALHTLYIAALVTGALASQALLLLALAAYATYCVNAAQYVWKFRLARLSTPEPAAVTA